MFKGMLLMSYDFRLIVNILNLSDKYAYYPDVPIFIGSYTPILTLWYPSSKFSNFEYDKSTPPLPLLQAINRYSSASIVQFLS